MNERERRRIRVQLTFLLTTFGFVLVACAPTPTQATTTATEIPDLKIFLSEPKGKWVAKNGAYKRNAGDAANEAARLDLTSDPVACAYSLALLPPFIYDEKNPSASEFPPGTEADLTLDCLREYINALPTPSQN